MSSELCATRLIVGWQEKSLVTWLDRAVQKLCGGAEI